MKYTEWSELRATLDVDPEAVAIAESAIESAVAAYLLCELRKSKGLSQAQVASRMGVSQRRVSAIERGEVNRSEVETIRSYIHALGGQVHLVAELDDQVIRIA